MHNKFSLEFRMENAAFADGEAPSEAARILREVADQIECFKDGGAIHDANGNKVGSWFADFPEEDEEEEEED